MGGLQRLRKESWSSRVEARTRLNPSQYWSKVREMRKRSKCQKKVEWIRMKSLDCDNHCICTWMKQYREEWNLVDETVIGCKNVDEIYKEMRDKMIEELESWNKEVEKTKDEILIEKMVNVFGDVVLDGEEKAFLSLGLDFTLFEQISMKRIDIDFL